MGEHGLESLVAYEAELLALRSTVEEQVQLVGKLEKDLSTIGGRTAVDEDLTTLEVLESLAETSSRDADGSVVAIVTSQRDRFKHRSQQLEEELVIEKTRQAVLQTEVDKLKEDNVKLYGKIKFLQCYGGKNSVAVPMDTAGNYSEQYESRLDPFRKFNQTEQHRSYTKLKIHDRASLSIGRAIMSSASARMMFFFYLLLMHLLVFMVLYRYAYTESCERNFQQDCVEKFEQHMSQHHPGGAHHG